MPTVSFPASDAARQRLQPETDFYKTQTFFEFFLDTIPCS
jgi:hypothetical protein